MVEETAFMTDSASGFENKNKCCKFCKKRISTQVMVDPTLCDSGAETNSIGKKEPEGKHKIDYRCKDIGSLVTALNRLSSVLAKSESSKAAGTEGELEVSEYLSKQASDAIRCVKLCLLGLPNGSQSLEHHKTREAFIESIIQGELSDVLNSFVSNTVSANHFIHVNTLGTDLSLNEINCSEESLQQGIDGRYEKVGSIKGANEPMYKAMQNYPMPSSKFVARGLLPYNEETLQRLPANSTWFPCQTNDQSCETRIEYQAIPNDKFKRSGARKLSQQSALLKEYRMNLRANQESGADSKLSQTLRAHNKNSFPSRTKQQTLIDSHSDDFTMPLTSSKWKDNNAVGFRRFNDRKHPRRKILQHKHYPDDKYTDSSSSHRRNQESSGSTSYAAEGFHTPAHNWSQNYVTSTESSESEMFSPLPSGGQTLSSNVSDEDYEQTSSRTSYGSEEYSLTSRATSDEVSLSDDSEGYGLSSHGQTRKLQHHKKPSYLSIDSTSNRIGPTRKSKLPKVMNLKKHGGGAWKKLKDKLSIIFHHHHHHHHHHHQRPTKRDDKDHSTHDIRTKHGKQTVDKVEKSIIKAGGTRKDEHKHLSSLVGALFRHIGHKKKSKSNASIIKQLGKGKHGAKNVWKKKH